MISSSWVQRQLLVRLLRKATHKRLSFSAIQRHMQRKRKSRNNTTFEDLRADLVNARDGMVDMNLAIALPPGNATCHFPVVHHERTGRIVVHRARANRQRAIEYLETHCPVR